MFEGLLETLQQFEVITLYRHTSPDCDALGSQWGLASWLIYALVTQSRFALAAFWMGGFVNAWPGMVLQVVLVPLIVMALERARLIPLKEK